MLLACCAKEKESRQLSIRAVAVTRISPNLFWPQLLLVCAPTMKPVSKVYTGFTQTVVLNLCLLLFVTASSTPLAPHLWVVLPRLRLGGPQVDFVKSTWVESSRVTSKTWLDSEVNSSQLQVTRVDLESGFVRENAGWSTDFHSNDVDTSFRANVRDLLLRSV